MNFKNIWSLNSYFQKAKNKISFIFTKKRYFYRFEIDFQQQKSSNQGQVYRKK